VEAVGVGMGEDTDSNDDDNDGNDDELADDVEWDILENEDALKGIGLSLQESGPFRFHGGEGTSGEPAEDVLSASLRSQQARAALPPRPRF